MKRHGKWCEKDDDDDDDDTADRLTRHAMGLKYNTKSNHTVQSIQ